MGLTRSFLRGMGITEEQVSAIIEAHTETTDALKAQRDEYKANSDKLADAERELESLRGNDNEWKAKYEKEHSEYETFKNEVANKNAIEEKKQAYIDLLKESGVSEKRISTVMKVTDLKDIEVVDGKIKDAEKLAESIKTEWADFIVSEETRGAGTQTPPPGSNGMTKEDILKIKDVAERQKAIAEHHELFGF